MDNDAIIQKLITIPSIGLKTAQLFTQNIKSFLYFLKLTNLQHKLNEFFQIKTQTTSTPTTPTPNEFINKNIVLSGFRNENLKNNLLKINVPLSNSVSKNTACVIIMDDDINSNKIIKAKTLNIPIYKLNEFLNKYPFVLS